MSAASPISSSTIAAWRGPGPRRRDKAMAQLSDDCFAFGGELMRADVALKILGERIVTVTEEATAPLTAARGRILAADIVAARSVPPHDNAAVDGYAVFFDDLDAKGETRLKVAEIG